MKADVSKFTEFRKYYLSEFEWFDGEDYITDRGRINVITYDLMTDKHGGLYFEYGALFTRIYLDDFEEAA